MKLDQSTKFLIVGLGQLGGAYAQALSAQGFTVGAIDIDPEAVPYALERGWIRHGRSWNDPDYIGGFDLIISALYPTVFLDWVRENQGAFRSGALLTDVTGVKTAVVYPIQSVLRADVEYIPAHPMAGRETSGVRNANCQVFRGANYLVTPTDKNTPEAIETCKALGRLLGFERISVITPEAHDEIIAFLSQLTHCIAVALMISSDSDKLVDYTGDSFRDLTRIGKINDEMWSELFLVNKEQLLKEMDLFSASFQTLRQTIETGDRETMRALMRTSTERRKRFDRETNT